MGASDSQAEAENREWLCIRGGNLELLQFYKKTYSPENSRQSGATDLLTC